MVEINEKKTVRKVKDAAQRVTQAETEAAPKREYRSLLIQVALVLVVVAFGALTFLVETIPFFSVDLQITQALQSIDSPVFLAAMRAISWAGFPPQSFILTSLVILIIYLIGLRWEAVMTTVAALSSTALNVLVKELIARPRPTIDLVQVFRILESYSFPSGHVMFYVGFFGFLWFLAYTLFRPSIWRTLLLVILGILVSLVGVSRIYLGQHWASDVLGAYLLGGLVLVGVIFMYRWGKTRFFVHQPAARPDSAEE